METTVIATDNMDLTDALAASVDIVRATKSETVKQASTRRYIDHRGHNHPLTPKARAACRAGTCVTARESLSVIQLHGSKTWHLANVSDAAGVMSGVVCTGKSASDGRYLLDTDDVHPVTCKNCLKKINK